MKSNKIVLTGSIASGKSSVAKILRENGFTVIDSDEISRDLTKKNGRAIPFIEKEFKNVINDGELDRKALSNIVFNDDGARNRLNDILHPMIIDEIKKEVYTDNSDIVFFDIPLYFEIEADIKDCFDKVVVVYVSEELQIKRLMERDKIDEKEAIKIIASQIHIEEKAKMADYLINNEGTIEELKENVEKFLRCIER